MVSLDFFCGEGKGGLLFLGRKDWGSGLSFIT